MIVHESSLFPGIHATLAAELGMEDKVVGIYQCTIRLDLDNYNNDTEDGLHITSMTGNWLTIVQEFAQMKTNHEQLRSALFLPKIWPVCSFHISYRSRLLLVVVSNRQVTLNLLSGKTLPLEVHEKVYVLADYLTIPLRGGEADV